MFIMKVSTMSGKQYVRMMQFIILRSCNINDFNRIDGEVLDYVEMTEMTIPRHILS